MSKIEKAVSFMENVANDNSHGYDQIDRWGNPDYDCSGLTITAWEKAGVPVKSKGGATYTGNIRRAFLANGFEDVTALVNRNNAAGMKRGDVLLHEGHHVAVYCGNGKEVEASINEKGGIKGGKPGDQTGREILIRPYRNHPWSHVLRYKEATATTTATSTKTTTAAATATKPNKTVKVIAKSGLNVRESASITGRKLFAVPNGTKLTWVQQKTKTANGYTWYRVKYNGTKGWAVGKWLQ